MGTKLMSREELKEQFIKDNAKKSKQKSNKTQTGVEFVSPEYNKKGRNGAHYGFEHKRLSVQSAISTRY